jgi:Na+/proline symporter
MLWTHFEQPQVTNFMTQSRNKWKTNTIIFISIYSILFLFLWAVLNSLINMPHLIEAFSEENDENF